MRRYTKLVRLYRKGYRYELELVAKLNRMGYATLRAPASGKGGRPDIIAIRKGVVVVFEVKVRSRAGDVYIPWYVVEKLKAWAERAGAVAYIAVKRLNISEWRLIPLDMLERTNGYYRISRRTFWKGYELDILK